MQYDDFVAEINSITEQLTKTQKTLWKTQDKLKVSEDKVQGYEAHIAELSAAHQSDVSLIDMLRNENSQFLEEEAKLRESLELMKKVFTRTKMMSKEDKETIELLEQERDLVVKENDALRKASIEGRMDQELLSKLQEESTSRETFLKEMLEKTSAELKFYKKKQVNAENAIQSLTKQLLKSNNQGTMPEGTQQEIKKQRKIIDQLELKVQELTDKRKEKDEDEDYDEDEPNLLNKAYFDEDLEDGLARAFMRRVEDLLVFGIGGQQQKSM